MTAADLLREVQAHDAFVWADGENLALDVPDDFPERLIDALTENKTELLATLKPTQEGYVGLPKAQVEMAETVNDKYGITDSDHRRYNVLSWVRGYYQFRNENHGDHYEAILHEFKRLSRILDEKGIG